MKKSIIKNWFITILLLCSAFFFSLLLHYVAELREPITTLFVFCVFLISLLTNGYVYGVFGAIVGTMAVNYAFTFPYFRVNFIIPVNLMSGIIMIVIAVLTSMLTIKIKKHEVWKSESEKERMRANLLRAVSHDLRTPLTTIYGFSEMILEQKDSLTEERMTKMVEGIKEDAEWLIRMVENLLSVTRIDSGNVKINKIPMVLDELIDSVIIKFHKRYPEQEVLISMPDDVVMIPMDAILIEQVIINILENAVQHAKGMTKLALKVEIQNEKAVFRIRDDGCGISEERLDGIFKGEYSMKAETADGHKRNAGIGLSVCATIIKAHGGNIVARNDKAGGAVFEFTLDTENLDNE